MGGYTDPRALDVCLVEGGIASACALPIPFLDSFEAVVVLLWLLLFFGGCLLPTMFGVMLNALPKNQRAFGNSTAHLIQNITGYFPAPLLYGAANSLFAGTT
jgi:sugar phosphate permease